MYCFWSIRGYSMLSRRIILLIRFFVVFLHSRLSLSGLSQYSHKILKVFVPHLTLDQTTECIKVIAERKAIFGTQRSNKVILELSEFPMSEKFEDMTESSVWRWKLITTDLLPDDSLSSEKKSAWTKLGKLANIFKCCRRMVVNLLECDIDKLEDKITKDRQLLLKFEFEEEKQRQQQKRREFEQAEKAKAVATKKAQRNAEKLAKKEEAKKLKEQEKKAKEKERRAELLAKEQAAKKKKERFASFFPTKKIRTSPCLGGRSFSVAASFGLKADFNSADFWSKVNASVDHINSSNMFETTTMRAKKSKKKTVKTIPLTVTINPDISSNPFQNTSVYCEQKTVYIRGRYRYLKFHEDYRPPYHGTW